ncbi:uncharacterized protein EI90DRAFT_1515994 [Cantharellus anzutake]|uniref:uncharacterized protein n=1 Tax=Cantharellus anzutake TaxID=1750568 RepID=UPI0019044453|nr:uncharacterized protein EI90DRAFT_1515994 [Cantharellus anzutake]KAF8328701.1 hypothetical protein EI90DRAFT_1515994 [Cantharellus anzutake]
MTQPLSSSPVSPKGQGSLTYTTVLPQRKTISPSGPTSSASALTGCTTLSSVPPPPMPTIQGAPFPRTYCDGNHPNYPPLPASFPNPVLEPLTTRPVESWGSSLALSGSVPMASPNHHVRYSALPSIGVTYTVQDPSPPSESHQQTLEAMYSPYGTTQVLAGHSGGMGTQAGPCLDTTPLGIRGGMLLGSLNEAGC